MTWRTLPLLETVLFVAVGMGWRAWLQRRRTGSSGIMLFRTGGLQSLREAGILFVMLFYLSASAALLAGRLDVAPWPWRLVGALMVAVGIPLTLAAQLDMGPSWRIGIDEANTPGLVTTRWYAISRNPIYVFMFLVFGGLTLQLPTPLSALVYVGLCAGVMQQVRSEEAFLERKYGAEFRAYARRVGRFVPGVGLLRDGTARA